MMTSASNKNNIGQKPGSTTNGYGLRPESGKKRTSFLLHQQASHGVGSSKNNEVHQQHSEASFSRPGQGAGDLNTVTVESPKKIIQGRKPSGKSTKSNRATIAKKNLVNAHPTFFPSNSNT